MSAETGQVVPSAALLLADDRATSLRCVGTLDARTRSRLVSAVEQVLRFRPRAVTIDVEELRLADRDAAAALAQVQRMVEQSGATLRWRGLRADHLQVAPTLGRRAGEATAPLAAWLPSPHFPW
ncbi:MAG: STAS domain-containing protein [Actinomycetota bacterium]|nr:STAS domain-containing protein [Actinomycetota bacterium]